MLFRSLSRQFLEIRPRPNSPGPAPVAPFPWEEAPPFLGPALPACFRRRPTPRSISLCSPLQACKLFNYTHWRRVCDALFIIFSLVFFYTRLVLFPTQ